MIHETKTNLEGLMSDETNLQAKIEKRKHELSRAQNRLKSLQGVRPAYMDEYEKIEVELVELYDIYVEKFRNLAYLEQQLDEYNRGEQDKLEESEQTLKKMQSRLREEELQMLRGEQEIAEERPKRPHAAAGRRKRVDKDSGSEVSLSESDKQGGLVGQMLSDEEGESEGGSEEASQDDALSDEETGAIDEQMEESENDF